MSFLRDLLARPPTEKSRQKNAQVAVIYFSLLLMPFFMSIVTLMMDFAYSLGEFKLKEPLANTFPVSPTWEWAITKK